MEALELERLCQELWTELELVLLHLENESVRTGQYISSQDVLTAPFGVKVSVRISTNATTARI